MVGLFEAGGMEGGGDSLSGLIPAMMSSWSSSAVIVRIWNQHTCRTHTVSNVYSKHDGQRGALTAITTSMNGKSGSANPLVILIASFRDFLHFLRYTDGGAWSSAGVVG